MNRKASGRFRRCTCNMYVYMHNRVCTLAKPAMSSSVGLTQYMEVRWTPLVFKPNIIAYQHPSQNLLPHSADGAPNTRARGSE